MEPVCSASQGGLLTAGPPGEPGAFDVFLNSNGLFLLIFHKFLTLGTQIHKNLSSLVDIFMIFFVK